MQTITSEKTYTPLSITVALAIFVGGSVVSIIGPIVSYSSRLKEVETRQTAYDETQKRLLDSIDKLNEKQSVTNERLAEIAGSLDRSSKR